MNNLKSILDQTKQSIEENQHGQPTGNLVTNFHKNAGEANQDFRFGYAPQKIYNKNRGKFSGSMNSNPINVKKMPTINNVKMITKIPKNNNL